MIYEQTPQSKSSDYRVFGACAFCWSGETRLSYALELKSTDTNRWSVIKCIFEKYILWEKNSPKSWPMHEPKTVFSAEVSLRETQLYRYFHGHRISWSPRGAEHMFSDQVNKRSEFIWVWNDDISGTKVWNISTLIEPIRTHGVLKQCWWVTLVNNISQWSNQLHKHTECLQMHESAAGK